MSGPLDGCTVLVTRPRAQADALATPLEALGATIDFLPALTIAPPEDAAPLVQALQNIAQFDWVVFTSVNGVEAARAHLETIPANVKIAAVGPATAAALARSFRVPDVMPDEYISDALADALGKVDGLRLLFARGDRARKEIVATLRERGATVEDVVAYRIVPPSCDVNLPDRRPDWITFLSSSAVRGTRDLLTAQGRESWLRESRIACIGPVTADTVRELGYPVALTAREFTVAGLVEALKMENAHA